MVCLSYIVPSFIDILVFDRCSRLSAELSNRLDLVITVDNNGQSLWIVYWEVISFESKVVRLLSYFLQIFMVFKRWNNTTWEGRASVILVTLSLHIGSFASWKSHEKDISNGKSQHCKDLWQNKNILDWVWRLSGSK